MENLNETQFFDSVEKEEQNEARNILLKVSEALKEKGYTSYKIRKDKLIGEAQPTKIRSGDIASKETLNTICKLLDCQPGDILEYINID